MHTSTDALCIGPWQMKICSHDTNTLFLDVGDKYIEYSSFNYSWNDY